MLYFCCILLISPSPGPSPKFKSEIPKRPVQKGKGDFGLWAVSKILRDSHPPTHPNTFRGSGSGEYLVQIEALITPECQEGVSSPLHDPLHYPHWTPTHPKTFRGFSWKYMVQIEALSIRKVSHDPPCLSRTLSKTLPTRLSRNDWYMGLSLSAMRLRV